MTQVYGIIGIELWSEALDPECMHCAQNDEHSPLTAVNSVETSTNNATIPPVLSVIINGRRNKKPLGLLGGPTDLRRP